MIADLIAWAVVAMAIMIVVPLSIALGIWLRNRARRPKRLETWRDLQKAINRGAYVDMSEHTNDLIKEIEQLKKEVHNED